MRQQSGEHNNPQAFPMVPAQFYVEIQAGETRLSSNKTKDVSMRGLFLYSGTTLPVGTECHVRIFLQGGPDLPIETRARVVREDANGLAVEFCDSEVESRSPLHNLSLYSSADFAQVQSEPVQQLDLKRHKF